MSKGLKVLLVDDDSNMLELMSHILTKDGIESSCALNGEEALNLYNTNEYHVVITDVLMPNVDGIELCKSLRGKVPIVILTAYEDLNLAGKVEDLCECILEKKDLAQSLSRATVKAYERYQLNHADYNSVNKAA